MSNGSDTTGGGTGLPPPAAMEGVLDMLGNSKTLDQIGRALGNAFARVVRAGRIKDALSGTWLGHPLHPLLTDIPIGAWTSSLLFDALRDPRLEGASDALVGVGVLTALPTAVTGLSDLTDAVADEDRRIGAAHAAGNITAVVLYAASYIARKRGRRIAGRILSELGMISVSGAGFLGGHLAYRRGMGVDQNAFDSSPGDWKAVLDEADLPERKACRIEIDGNGVLVFRNGERVFAIANRCSHRGGPLHKGSVDDGTVTCPWHLSTFRLDDGSVVRGPATAPQPAFEARIRDGNVEIRVQASR